MFNQSIDERLSTWYELRKQVEISETPFHDVWDFWKDAPFIPYNRKVDPFNQYNWPTPWEIIVENKYDDFTKSLMIAWSLKFTERFKNSNIDIQTFLDSKKNLQYNVICIDKEWAINFDNEGPGLMKNIPTSFLLENIIEVKVPR